MNKRKIVTFLIMLVVTIPICAVVSYIFHLILSGENFEISSVEAKSVIQSIFGNAKHFELYLILQAFFILFLVVVTFIQKSNVYENGLYEVTDKIKTPVACGQGQHGTARWLTDSEYKKVFKLAGESIIISDSKGEIRDYTADFLENLGYEVIVIDFNDKEKSNRYNFLQPIIDAVNAEEYQKAEDLAWDLTASLVGEDNSKMERIWKDGEMSIITGAMIAVVYENKEHPEFQNLTNVYSFISEMCRPENGVVPINDYIKDLDESNPATRIFGIARIAPEKTRGSFFTAALTTLRLFTNEGVYGMTCESDFLLKDTGKKKTAIYMIVQDDKTTYYPLASLFVNQQYTSLVEVAKARGGD